MLLVLTVILGVAYPLVITLIAHLPGLDHRANGSTLTHNGKVVGSSRIGQSFTDYNGAILYNALTFGIASLGAPLVLRRSYRPLIASSPRHRLLLRVWLVIYAFVGVQMGWLLRPFIGDPLKPVEFFRPDSWGNAYVIVARMVWDQFGGVFSHR